MCDFPVLRIYKGAFGARCLVCLSTFIHRAVGLVLDAMKLENNIRVYELSSRGALFKYLKRRFRDFTFSEYYDDINLGEFKKGVQCQDIQKLTFNDEVFDLITSTEVFEHVPDDLVGFREIYRVLKRGGYFVFTVPLSESASTVERALIKDGKIVYILPQQYHDDCIRGKRKVLAFRNYGLDIQSRLESVGFRVRINIINNYGYAIENAKVIVCKK